MVLDAEKGQLGRAGAGNAHWDERCLRGGSLINPVLPVFIIREAGAGSCAGRKAASGGSRVVRRLFTNTDTQQNIHVSLSHGSVARLLDYLSGSIIIVTLSRLVFHTLSGWREAYSENQPDPTGKSVAQP